MFFHLKDVGSVDEAHEGQEAAVRPAVDGDATQVYKLVLVCDVVQTLHLVFNLHLTLDRGEKIELGSFVSTEEN